MTIILVFTLKRSQLEIFAEILKICKHPATRCKVLRKVYLPWRLGNDYLENMLSTGLLNTNSDISCYLTTLKGHVFLKKWDELDELDYNRMYATKFFSKSNSVSRTQEATVCTSY